MALKTIPIRKDAEGRLLDSSGEKIAVSYRYNDKTKVWDIPIHLGDKYTLDADGNIDKEFEGFVPYKDKYLTNIILSCLCKHFKTIDVERLHIFEFEDDLAYGVFKHDGKNYTVAYRVGDSFDEDEFNISLYEQ